MFLRRDVLRLGVLVVVTLCGVLSWGVEEVG